MTEANSIRTLAPFAQHACFNIWRLEPGGLKVPKHHDGATNHSTMNPAVPLTAGQAFEWLTHLRASGVGHDRAGEIGYVGMGFRPGGTGLVCLDVDKCIAADGTWSAVALNMAARFAGSLIEISTSGTGLHFWFTSREAIGRLGKDRAKELELYGDGQFIATGTVIGGDAVTDCTEAMVLLISERWDRGSRPDAWRSADWESKTPDERAKVTSDLRSALAVLDADDRDTWVGVGQALSGLGDVGYDLWATWSNTVKYPGGDDLGKWESFSGDKTDYPAVFTRAEATGQWVNPARRPEVDIAQFGSAPLPAAARVERPAAAVAVGGTFVAASAGAIPATIANVHDALISSEGEVQLRYDTFQDAVMIGARPLEDEDYGHLRAAFERRGFKPVAAEVMRTCVQMVAKRNRYDSAIEWLGGLVWDGVSRVDAAMSRYYGCAPGPYAVAVARYLFSAMAGRCMHAGIKADMAVVLVGLQGAQKTSAVQALVPDLQFFGEVDLDKSDDSLARSMRGKLVMELAELKGLSGRDAESTKAWISRQIEEWVPKYKELGTRYGRRCVLVGTDNKGEFLDDETGARRILPITVSRADVALLQTDRDQLWAEGLAIFRSSGIQWSDAEVLARAEHGKYEVVDELQSAIHGWLESVPVPRLGMPQSVRTHGEDPVRGHDILTGALGMQLSQIKKIDEMRLAKIMRKLNYVRETKWLHNRSVKVWVRGGN